ncbi:MAG: thioesterase [Chloroflexaceae bacterium]|nr:thioesterase [Chloroflexaceae bacterium]
MAKQINPWIFCARPNSQAKLRLFCFPCAGGLPGIYGPWVKQLPATVELCALQLPGRGRRTQEASITQLPELLAQLVPAIADYAPLPFAFLGHSFGGILGFEVAHELRRQFSLSPEHLCVCACAAPQVH